MRPGVLDISSSEFGDSDAEAGDTDSKCKEHLRDEAIRTIEEHFTPKSVQVGQQKGSWTFKRFLLYCRLLDYVEKECGLL